MGNPKKYTSSYLRDSCTRISAARTHQWRLSWSDRGVWKKFDHPHLVTFLEVDAQTPRNYMIDGLIIKKDVGLNKIAKPIPLFTILKKLSVSLVSSSYIHLHSSSLRPRRLLRHYKQKQIKYKNIERLVMTISIFNRRTLNSTPCHIGWV